MLSSTSVADEAVVECNADFGASDEDSGDAL